MKTIRLELTVAEANLIVESLGQMPYVRVFELIQKLQAQAQHQLNQEQAGAEPRPLQGNSDGGH